MQVTGPYDVISAARRLLPKTLQILGGESITNFEWYMRDEMPVTAPNAKGKPLPYPHGVFHILSPVRFVDAVSSQPDDRYREILTSQVDSLSFTNGILSYEVTQQDIASVTSVVGMAALGSPASVIHAMDSLTNTVVAFGTPSVVAPLDQGSGAIRIGSIISPGANLAILFPSRNMIGVSFRITKRKEAGGSDSINVRLRDAAGKFRNYTAISEVAGDVGVVKTFIYVVNTFTSEDSGFNAGQVVALELTDIDNENTFDALCVSGVPYTFLPTVDYTFDRKSIIWTESGERPPDGTPFTVTYNHRMFVQRFLMGSKITIRAIVKAKEYSSPLGRKYSKAMLASVLGNSLEMNLRSRSGSRMTLPGTPDVPYTETMTLGRILSGGPLSVDESGSVAPWFIDFQINLGAVMETDPVQSILTVPFTGTGVPD